MRGIEHEFFEIRNPSHNLRRLSCFFIPIQWNFFSFISGQNKNSNDFKLKNYRRNGKKRKCKELNLATRIFFFYFSVFVPIRHFRHIYLSWWKKITPLPFWFAPIQSIDRSIGLKKNQKKKKLISWQTHHYLLRWVSFMDRFIKRSKDFFSSFHHRILDFPSLIVFSRFVWNHFKNVFIV